jgi:methanogenic corrinoid protein MtbC1
MFPISFISRETGISAATLRKWEQRYGFPKPDRENNRRTYSEEELTSLREIKRLLDQGARPSTVLSDSTRFTASLNICSPAQSKQSIFIETALSLLIEHRVRELCLLLEKKLKKLGTFRFVNEVAAPLTTVVGDNWANGTISIFAEHCYTTQMYALLTSVVKPIPNTEHIPRVLLATIPGEKHTLGISMVQALLSEQEAYCINLGSELPLLEFPKAVTHYQAHIFGISFSSAFPKRAIVPALVKLRDVLPAHITLWIGGTGAKLLDTIPDGVQSLTSASAVVAAYTEYKEQFKVNQKFFLHQ